MPPKFSSVSQCLAPLMGAPGSRDRSLRVGRGREDRDQHADTDFTLKTVVTMATGYT